MTNMISMMCKFLVVHLALIDGFMSFLILRLLRFLGRITVRSYIIHLLLKQSGGSTVILLHSWPLIIFLWIFHVRMWLKTVVWSRLRRHAEKRVSSSAPSSSLDSCTHSSGYVLYRPHSSPTASHPSVLSDQPC